MRKLECIKKNKEICILFVLSTFLFLYQHFKILSWDFSAYVLNAKYLFYNGAYFETLRAPMAPLLLGIFLIFGSFGEYLYIIFVASLFFYSCIRFSDIIFEKWFVYKNISRWFIRFVFYFFSLGSFTLIYGIGAGTELLALSFFILFSVHLLNGKVSGHYLALAFLTRYSFLLFFPLLFFNKSLKKIGKNIGLFFIIIFPWFLFNYLKFGNWFTSFVDSYANNILFRDYLFQAFNFKDILAVVNWFLPFFALGFLYSVYHIYKTRKNWFINNRAYLFFILVFFLIIYDYSNIPLKQVRYLFNLIFPVAFFCVLSILVPLARSVRKEKIEKIIAAIFLLFFVFTFFSLIGAYKVISGESNKFIMAADSMRELRIENCEILTPNWVLVSYFTENAYPLGLNKIPDVLAENKIVLIFNNTHTIDDRFTEEELRNYSTLYSTYHYTFYVDDKFKIENCSEKYVFDEPYVNNHCEIIAERFEKLKLNRAVLNICEAVNKK